MGTHNRIAPSRRIVTPSHSIVIPGEALSSRAKRGILVSACTASEQTKAETFLQPSAPYRATSLISASRFPSESRKNVIHKSCVGIFAITCGSSSKRTPPSFSLP